MSVVSRYRTFLLPLKQGGTLHFGLSKVTLRNWSVEPQPFPREEAIQGGAILSLVMR